MKDALLIIFSQDWLVHLQENQLPQETKTSHLAKFTESSIEQLFIDKLVYYPDVIIKDDAFPEGIFQKEILPAASLGENLKSVFQQGFDKGYKRIVLIGMEHSSLITEQEISEAFHLLTSKDVVFGPLTNGRYYLVGLKKPFPALFEDKPWGTEEVFKKSYLEALSDGRSIALTEEKSPVDLPGVSQEEPAYFY